LQQILVVAQPHETLGIAHELVGHGEVDRAHKGIDDEAKDEDGGRQQKEVGEHRVARQSERAPASP